MGDKDSLISIIVPVYNVEKYLTCCIESVLAQTYKNWELILIDDGSEDSSGVICDEYSRKDKRIKTIHKSNEGVSISRNIGVKEASGEYIVFLDSDDYLDVDTLKILLENILNYNADGSFGAIKYVNEKNEKMVEYILPESKIEGSEKFNSLFQDLYNNYCFHAVWGKLFKKNIIIDNKICFEENFSILEDGMFVSDYLSFSNNFVVSSKAFYNYRQFESDSLMKKFNRNAMDALSRKYEKDAFFRAKFNKDNELFYARKIFVYIYNYILQIYIRSNYSYHEQEELLREYLSKQVVTETLDRIKSLNKISKKDKFKCFMLNINPKILHFILYCKCRLKR